MTAPVPVTPSKAKAWLALAGGLLGSLVPTLAQIAGFLPAPWGPLLTGIIGLIAMLTGAAVHQAPYKPAGTVLVVPPEDVSPSDPAGGPYSSPWPKP